MTDRISTQLVTIPLDDGVLVYHRWFGNPVIVSPETFEDIEGHNLDSLGQDPDQYALLRQAGVVASEGLDEQKSFAQAVSGHSSSAQQGGALSKLDLIVSEQCNLGCGHCIFYAGNDRSFAPGTLMTIETAQDAWQRYLTKARENGVTQFPVHFGGAEPLLNWKLVSNVLESFPDDLAENEQIEWSINSNLFTLTDEMAKSFFEHEVAVHTSIDGGREANDAIRVNLAGRGTFDRIWSRIELLRRHGVTVFDLSATLTSGNFHLFDLESFTGWLADNEIHAVGIDVDLIGSPDIPVFDASETLVQTYWECHSKNIECSGTWLTPFLNIVNKDIRQDHVAFCGAIKGHGLSVTPTGDVTLCSYMASRVGSLNDWDQLFVPGGRFSTLVDSRQPGQDPHCVGCDIEGHCGGQCHITREISPSNPGILERMCDFYRRVTRRMLVCHAAGEYVAPTDNDQGNKLCPPQSRGRSRLSLL